MINTQPEKEVCSRGQSLPLHRTKLCLHQWRPPSYAADAAAAAAAVALQVFEEVRSRRWKEFCPQRAFG